VSYPRDHVLIHYSVRLTDDIDSNLDLSSTHRFSFCEAPREFLANAFENNAAADFGCRGLIASHANPLHYNPEIAEKFANSAASIHVSKPSHSKRSTTDFLVSLIASHAQVDTHNDCL